MKFLIASVLLMLPISHGKSINVLKNSISNDSEFEKLLRDSIENFRDAMTKGIPDLGMPVLDPFKGIGHVFPIRDDMISMDLTILEVTFEDASKFTIQNLQADEDMKFHIELCFNQIVAYGAYDVQGTVAKIFPLWGNGNFSIYVKDINIIANGKFISKDETLELSNLDWDLNWDQLIISADNFLGSGEFSKAVLKMLSKLAKNMFEMYEEDVFNNLNPLVVEAINYLIQHYGVVEAADIHLLSKNY